MKDTYDWIDYFDKFFEEVKRQFRQYYPFQDKSEVSPKLATLIDAVTNLPVPADIVNIKVDLSKHLDIEDEICHLMRFDFSKYGTHSVSYHGLVDSNTPEELSRLLKKIFCFDDAERLADHFCRELRTVGFTDEKNPDVYFMFARYDIRKNLGRFADWFLTWFMTPMLPVRVTERFLKKEVEFNALYGLTSDPISSISENVEQSKRRTYPRMSFEQLQQEVCDIQLIPKVPEDVQRVFKCAKDLYLFGWFRYHFFTVSYHYTFLALESAIKHRYIQSLGGRAILTNRKGETMEIPKQSYEELWIFVRFDRKLGRDLKGIRVNNEPFPYNMRKLLDWLVSKRLITKWERHSFDVGIQLRNSLSHLEKASIFMPSAQVLRNVAYQINTLFHSENT